MTDEQKKPEEKKEARTCTVCGQSEDKKSPAGDCPATDKFGIHNFTAEGDDKPDDLTKQKRPPQTPPSREELDQILKQRQEQPPDRPLGS